MYDEADLQYAAGFLDGEGCFTITNRHYCRAKVLCENTYRPVIEWLHKTFGGLVRFDIAGKKANHRATHRWELSDRHAADFCAVIAPYLREKTEQALLVIAIQQTKGTLIGRRVAPHLMRERHRLADILRDRKGRV